MIDSSVDVEIRRAETDLKLAQARKAVVETECLEADLKSKQEKKRSINWQEFIKTVGAAILGLGGIVAAVTQYQIAQKDAQIAKIQIVTANQQLAEKKQEIQRAKDELAAVSSRKDSAVKEQQGAEEAKRKAETGRHEAEIALNEYKAELAQLRSKVKKENPALVQDRLVYIQFRGGLSRKLINELRAALKRSGFNNPGAERLAGEYRSVVKYFDSDTSSAENLASETEKFFDKEGCPINIEVVPVKSKAEPPPPSEIWLHHSCS